MKSILSDKLEFLRADGIVVNKEKYLIQLNRKKYDEMNTEIDQIVVIELEMEANVTAIVVTKGSFDLRILISQCQNGQTKMKLYP